MSGARTHGDGPRTPARTAAQVALLVATLAGAAPASAQEAFDLQFDHSTVLVTDRETCGEFYEKIRQLETLETPWGAPHPCASLMRGRTIGLDQSHDEVGMGLG